jgi:hypothetical protein
MVGFCRQNQGNHFFVNLTIVVVRNEGLNIHPFEKCTKKYQTHVYLFELAKNSKPLKINN